MLISVIFFQQKKEMTIRKEHFNKTTGNKVNNLNYIYYYIYYENLQCQWIHFVINTITRLVETCFFLFNRSFSKSLTCLWHRKRKHFPRIKKILNYKTALAPKHSGFWRKSTAGLKITVIFIHNKMFKHIRHETSPIYP